MNPSTRYRPPPPHGQGGETWLEAFKRGGRDALRLAAREIPDAHVWVVLAELADRYYSRDDYDLAGEP